MRVNDEAAQLAAAFLQFRRYRSEILPKDIFGEPAWDLLLEIFVADANGLPMTGSIVAQRDAVPGAVMSRWLKHLTTAGLLIGDGSGNLDDELTLSGRGMEAIEAIIGEARNLKDSFLRPSHAES
ncbi:MULTISPECIES: hypothetical protein [unclassified Sphingomonas]|uniref:hypothetical protein n=1 Tax=Sphingomonas sp. PvP015 TaxID=3156388 RepID=UPI00339262D5